jgi:hypothetical protein
MPGFTAEFVGELQGNIHIVVLHGRTIARQDKEEYSTHGARWTHLAIDRKTGWEARATFGK